MPIKVENISYTYNPGTPREVKALKNVSFSIKSGETVAIIGHTGSGKSTLIQQLNGLLYPTEGLVTVDDMPLKPKTKDLPKIRQKVGLVFQYPEYQLFEETVFEDIAFGPKNMGITGEELSNRVRWAMNMVNLDYKKYKDVSPFDLSGGQKRKVAIAGVVAMIPKYLILDEPCAGLDPRGREEVLGTLKHLNEKGMAIIMVSHSMDEVALFAKRLIVVNDGSVVYDDETSKVFTQAEKLRKMGLDVPEVMKIMLLLKEKGYDVPTDVLSIDQAVEAIREGWLHA